MKNKLFLVLIFLTTLVGYGYSQNEITGTDCISVGSTAYFTLDANYLEHATSHTWRLLVDNGVQNSYQEFQNITDPTSTIGLRINNFAKTTFKMTVAVQYDGAPYYRECYREVSVCGNPGIGVSQVDISMETGGTEPEVKIWAHTLPAIQGRPSTFEAKVVDPNGTFLATNYFLDGVAVATGSTLAMIMPNAGQHLIVAVSSFSDGTEARDSLIVNVRNTTAVCRDKSITIFAPNENNYPYPPLGTYQFKTEIYDPCNQLIEVQKYVTSSRYVEYWHTKSHTSYVNFTHRGHYKLDVYASFADGTSLHTYAIYLVGDDMIEYFPDGINGPEDVLPGSTAEYILPVQNCENSFAIRWWVNGATKSIVPNGNRVKVEFSDFYTGADVCCGVEYFEEPWYEQMCITIGKAEPVPQPELCVVAPNPSSDVFTLTALADIDYYTVSNVKYCMNSAGSGIFEGESVSFGWNYQPGVYALTVYSLAGESQTMTLVKE